MKDEIIAHRASLQGALSRAAYDLREYAGYQQRVDGKWDHHKQALVDLAIRLESADADLRELVEAILTAQPRRVLLEAVKPFRGVTE